MVREVARCISPNVNSGSQKATSQCRGLPIMTKHYAYFNNEVKSAIINALPSQKETVEQKSEPTDENVVFPVFGKNKKAPTC